MKKLLLLFFLLSFFTINVKGQFPYDSIKGQYPYEKFPAIKFKTKGKWVVYDMRDKENKMHWTMTFPKFYGNKDDMTVEITTFGYKDTSEIRIFKNKKQIQKIVEPFAIGRRWSMLLDSVYYTDINGDSLVDLKILCWYGGCGIAMLNMRVIYLFQQKDNTFKKVSYVDMALEQAERDFSGDGNYEIMTRSLDHYQGHSYWTYNLYNYKNEKFICVNDKFNYPIMIQYLNRENFKVTEKISKQKMKTFSRKLPEDFDIR